MEQQEFMKQVREQIAAMKQAAQPGIDPWVTQKQEKEVLIEFFKHAAYAEYRSAISNAKHFITTPNDKPDLKEALAMEAYEEFQHYQVFARQLLKLGVTYDPETYTPVPAWREYFDNQEFARDGLEKIAAENIGGEPRAVAWLERVAAEGAEEMLREIAHPQLEDEYGHEQVGLQLIEKYATDSEVQQRFLAIAAKQQKLVVLAQQQLNERLGVKRGQA
jgi:tRNA isopentenyl-2-thiomethyl-A-37 hydroxylase MiaE